MFGTFHRNCRNSGCGLSKRYYRYHLFSKFLYRCLTRKPEQLTEEERGFVAQWHQEDLHTKYIYQALNHMRYVLKATTMAQAKRRLTEWFNDINFICVVPSLKSQ